MLQDADNFLVHAGFCGTYVPTQVFLLNFACLADKLA
jgi:hypothetical protein